MRELTDALNEQSKIFEHCNADPLEDERLEALLLAAQRLGAHAIRHHSGEALSRALGMCESVANYVYTMVDREGQ